MRNYTSLEDKILAAVWEL